jgi:hypothetical protein
MRPVAFDAEGQAHARRRLLLGDFKERGLALQMKPAVSQSQPGLSGEAEQEC